MKYLFTGLITGVILSLLVFQGQAASELYTGFYIDLAGIESIPFSDNRNASDFIVVPKGNVTWLFDGYGQLVKKIDTGALLAEYSGNGHYYVQYDKVGTSIELFGYNGERYWKLDSREKPFLSYNGKLVLLLNGDHSRIRVFDTNGNITGSGEISGRLCTSVEFSERNDYASIGFADGSYYFLDEKGSVIDKGNLPAGNMVKGVRISSNGKFGAVHYGSGEKDMLRVVIIGGDDFEETELANSHVVKTAMHISDSGMTAFFDIDHVLAVDDDCDDLFSFKVPAKRPGQSVITRSGGYYYLVYTKNTGESQFFIFNDEGSLFYSREFAGEAFLSACIRNAAAIVRGSETLFSCSVHVPGS